MSFTYEEKKEYELNRIRYDRNAQNVFFGKALGIQNSPKTYLKKFADDKMNLACDVLIGCNWCNNSMCDQCKLTEANRNAHEEIDNGIRKPPEKNGYFEQTVSMPGYWISASTNKKTGVITVTMRPFIPKGVENERQ